MGKKNGKPEAVPEVQKTAKCYKCKKYRRINNFSLDRARFNGVTSICRDCRKKRDFLRGKDKLYIARKMIYLRKYMVEYKDKWDARIKARMALKKKILKRKPCQHCGKKKAEMHHPDYSKPLKIIWLCRKCHATLHIELRKHTPPSGQFPDRV